MNGISVFLKTPEEMNAWFDGKWEPDQDFEHDERLLVHPADFQGSPIYVVAAAQNTVITIERTVRVGENPNLTDVHAVVHTLIDHLGILEVQRRSVEFRLVPDWREFLRRAK